uniref:Uncharacterized protein n=1 Tax=Laticauda laticaudata TaxID=8630 RepID=A0A8C5SVT7_LATLA
FCGCGLVGMLNYQEDIINLLLDCGADVNKCSDEGLSTLSMCMIHYFPAEGFQPNILEDILEETSKEPVPLSRSDISQLSEASTNATTPPSVEALSVSVEKTEFISDIEIKSSEETDNGEKSSGTICGVYNYKIKISPETMHHGAVVLSQHMLQTQCYPDTGDSVHQEGTLRRMAASLTEQKKRMSIIKMLLRRGADPNISNIPMHVLFFAVKSADAEVVQILLEAGARTDIRLPTRLGGVAPLHIAAALSGVEGIVITELLLHAAADPDVRAQNEDDIFRLDKIPFDIGESVSFIKMNNEPGPPKSYYKECNIVPEEGGRTPLHIACEREDNFMIETLIAAGADMLMPITLIDESRTAVGTVVDYAYFKYYQDKRLLHTPLHSLSPMERDTYAFRRKMLDFLSERLRDCVIEKEKQWDEEEFRKIKIGESKLKFKIKKQYKTVKFHKASEI